MHMVYLSHEIHSQEVLVFKIIYMGKLNTFKMAFSAAFASIALFGAFFTVIEPQFVRAATDSVQVTLTVTGGISITSGGDVTMSPNIDLTNATSTGSTTLTVITNDTDGYTLTVSAASSSAMQTAGGADNIADYLGATGTAWSISGGTAEFGYSAHGTDVPTAAWGTSGVCDSATLDDANRYYYGFTTSNQLIAQSNATTSEAGTVTTLCLAAEQNAFNIPNGVYTADLTATALVK